MHDNLTELPEAIPLHRVSPAWRLLAILAVIIALLALLGVLAMSVQIAVLQSQQTNRPIYVTPPPAPPPPAVVAVPIVNVPPDKPAVDPASLPYPVREDLRQSLGFATVPGEPGGTLRERFLRLGKEYWRSPSDGSIIAIAVAPNGTDVAMFNVAKLLAGPYNNLREIDEQPANGKAGVPTPTPPPVRREAAAGSRLVGHPVWSPDGRLIYFATAAGKLRRFDMQAQTLESLPFRGQWPTPWLNDRTQFLFVRTHPAPKFGPSDSDRTELVVGNIAAKTARVLVTASRAQWAHPVLSPDGKRIAIWSTLDQEAGRFRLLLINAMNGATSPVQGITTTRPGPIIWLSDEPMLIYERAVDPPLPPDCLAPEAHPVPNRSAGIFQYDLDKQTETRLSRGGGVGSPMVDQDGNLHHTAWQWQAERERNTLGLYRVPLATVRRWVEKLPASTPRDAEKWKELIASVCVKAEVPEDVTTFRPTPDRLARIADQFAGEYQKMFEKPPDGIAGHDRQLAELHDLPILAEIRPQLVIVLAAVQGEYLRKQHRAVWHIVDGPAISGAAENPFGQAVGFFAFVERGLTDSTAPSLNDLLGEAAGRTLVLTNNPIAAKAKLADLMDTDLARGIELVARGKPADAEKLLVKMVQREANRRNHHLALLAARFLYQQDRLAAVEAILEPLADEPPADPQVFNLLGLAVLDRDPRSATNGFKKSLRCDLRFGPAYFNLATAYQRTGDTPSAVACLKRYLELLPNGPLATDAARRLAELEDDKTR